LTFFFNILGTKNVDGKFVQGLKMLIANFTRLKMLMKFFTETKKCNNKREFVWWPKLYKDRMRVQYK